MEFFSAGHGGEGEGEAAVGVVLIFFPVGRGGEGVLQSCVHLVFRVSMLVLSLSWRSSSLASSGSHGGGQVC
jgi:hypothetical protein